MSRPHARHEPRLEAVGGQSLFGGVMSPPCRRGLQG